MNKRLKRIGILKAGVVLAVLYALFSLILVPFLMIGGTIAARAAAQSGGAEAPFGFLFGLGALFLPFLYGFFGFVIGIISAALYNLVAKMTGGIELTLEDVA
jgi:hypothetical protein